MWGGLQTPPSGLHQPLGVSWCQLSSARVQRFPQNLIASFAPGLLGGSMGKGEAGRKMSNEPQLCVHQGPDTLSCKEFWVCEQVQIREQPEGLRSSASTVGVRLVFP